MISKELATQYLDATRAMAFYNRLATGMAESFKPLFEGPHMEAATELFRKEFSGYLQSKSLEHVMLLLDPNEAEAAIRFYTSPEGTSIQSKTDTIYHMAEADAEVDLPKIMERVLTLASSPLTLDNMEN